MTASTPVRVELRDIVTDDDRAAVLALSVAPGQDRFVASVERSFRDAVVDARAEPRMWAIVDPATDTVVGFAMISDGIPRETLEANDDIVGPYFLWRLLIDRRFQGRGYGRATIDAVADYVRTRPDAEVLLTSCKAGEGSPQPFYLAYGFELTGKVMWGEDLLRLDLRDGNGGSA